MRRRTAWWASGAALVMILAGCTDDASSGAPAGASDAVVEFTAARGDRYEGKVRVAVHPLVVDGSTMELRLELTPVGGDPERDGEPISVEALIDRAPVLSDVRELTSYEVLGYPKEARHTDLDTTTTVGEAVLYQAWFAAPADDVRTLDLVVHPSWGSVTRVPVVRS